MQQADVKPRPLGLQTPVVTVRGCPQSLHTNIAIEPSYLSPTFVRSIRNYSDISVCITAGNTVLLQMLVVAQPVNKFPAFKGVDCSLPCSQNSATLPIQYTHSPAIFNLYFNVTLPCAPLPLKESIFFKFSDQNFICISHPPMDSTCSTLLILFDLTSLIMFGSQHKLMKFFLV
jgi:hypothetical protein